mgnify:CR=1 FL=1
MVADLLLWSPFELLSLINYPPFTVKIWTTLLRYHSFMLLEFGIIDGARITNWFDNLSCFKV